ncbi:putative methylthioribulose-1-phosphate dehydratase [Helianthus annuus]|nr:putative methylthioribulose-1-phosphate dehydratase [Helianthus annuus]KAJ0508159.1 putative methylthioribulose-1-phosphate dehydratase [Helianthus annuus]KAJ0688402.1 putative methylthioribulose-1-phosphate dehydratase [Helianthus annuus]KAJ0733645.1 putative methylthioribulose-1-phosphate dehydratase [Helianthus annuus]KAJ0869551.1 putative methylthioribulose-1-phosphate dehydratase [Helianthus annuus]
MYDDNNDQSYGDEQRFKGLDVELVVPIIENIVPERELTKSLVSPVEDDLQHGIVDVVLISFDGAGKHAMMIVALVANVEGMIKSDKKITSLKQLQVSKFNMLFSFFNQKIYFKLLNILIYGHIWCTGFEKNELKRVVFHDVFKKIAKEKK